MLNSAQYQLLHQGTVIPAHPLALTPNRTLDEQYQRLLTRYYIAAGAGGVAVGVHTTQFAIRDADVRLYEPVLSLAAQEVEKAQLKRPFLLIAGVSGDTKQACKEASLARSLGYHLALLSINGLGNWSEEALLERAKAVGEVIPLMGFYLQPAVGGRVFSKAYWYEFAQIPQVCAIKIAPFNRYQTLDVIQSVCRSDRRDEIALYTGNDDNIILDLLTTYTVQVGDTWYEKHIVGGLLGHWAVWTHAAVTQLAAIHKLKQQQVDISHSWLTKAQAITDANAAFFDAANQFKGCIAGIHEVLRRQGLMQGIACLNPDETLSPGQADEITRIYQAYPDLHDDAFVKTHLSTWLEAIQT